MTPIHVLNHAKLFGLFVAGSFALAAMVQAAELQPAGPMTAIPAAGQQIASFCGACSNSDHDACGGQSNGWSCCSSGCSDDKMQCHNVTSCDKLAGIGNRSGISLAIGLKTDAAVPALPVIRAQSNACTTWYNNLQAQISAHNSECSGTLSESQVAYCNNQAQRLNSERARYNAECG